MSTPNSEQKSSIKPRKKSKGKRKATSPLNDTGHCIEQSGQVNTSNGQVNVGNKGKKKHKNKQPAFVFPDPRAAPMMMNFHNRVRMACRVKVRVPHFSVKVLRCSLCPHVRHRQLNKRLVLSPQPHPKFLICQAPQTGPPN